MDVRFFLNLRLKFIRQYYETTTAPYVERKRQIDAGEEPWTPGYSEDPEPAFLSEWLEADESIQVIGGSCVSMLAATLHVYLKTWERLIGHPVDDTLKPAFKKGWLHGYKAYFARHSKIHFEHGPADLAVLEELILARNRIQHPQSITNDSVRYSEEDMAKVPHPFFIDEHDADLVSSVEEGERTWLMPPCIRITPEKLSAALAEVERFAHWLETGEIAPT